MSARGTWPDPERVFPLLVLYLQSRLILENYCCCALVLFVSAALPCEGQEQQDAEVFLDPLVAGTQCLALKPCSRKTSLRLSSAAM